MVFNSLSPTCAHKISTDAVFIWREINEIRLSSTLNTDSPNPLVPDRWLQCIEFALLMTTVFESVFWVEIELDECLEVSKVMDGCLEVSEVMGEVEFALTCFPSWYRFGKVWSVCSAVWKLVSQAWGCSSYLVNSVSWIWLLMIWHDHGLVGSSKLILDLS